MAENPNYSNADKWKFAAVDGLFLSLITVGVISLQLIPVMGKGILAALIWAIKFGGSIALLYYFMKRYSDNTPDDYNITNYGIRVCLFSSIICAVAAFMAYNFGMQQEINTVFDSVNDAIYASPNISSDDIDRAQEIMNWFEDNFASVMSITELFRDFIIGLIVSAIIGSAMRRKKMFPEWAAAQKEQNENEEKDELE